MWFSCVSVVSFGIALVFSSCCFISSPSLSTSYMICTSYILHIPQTKQSHERTWPMLAIVLNLIEGVRPELMCEGVSLAGFLFFVGIPCRMFWDFLFFLLLLRESLAGFLFLAGNPCGIFVFFVDFLAALAGGWGAQKPPSKWCVK